MFEELILQELTDEEASKHVGGCAACDDLGDDLGDE